MIILLILIIISIIKRKYFYILFIISIFAIIYIISRTGLSNYLSYQGFLIANSPIEAFKEKCISRNYNHSKDFTLAFCSKRNSFSTGYVDIMYDSGGDISLKYRYRSESWKTAFKNLAALSTNSVLYQIAQIEDIDSIYFSTMKIGDGFYEVTYSVEQFNER
jgi:hypothetical protein